MTQPGLADITVQPGQEAELAELLRLLASPLFSRAPSLTQLLTFLCRKHFAGEAPLIREHNIAIEALGRPHSFDQKRDSIVRVELHRLRKRLALYYQTEGAANPIQISIPPGCYAPRFAVKSTPLPAPSEAVPTQPAQAPRSRFHWRSIAALLGMTTAG